MSNAFGANGYCNGGDFTAAMDAIMKNFSTVETGADYPYNYSKYEEKWNNRETLSPILQAEDYAKPFNLY